MVAQLCYGLLCNALGCGCLMRTTARARMRALLRVVGGAIVGSICLQLCFEGVVGPLLPPSPQLVAMVVACGLALFERLWVGGRGRGGGGVGAEGRGVASPPQ